MANMLRKLNNGLSSDIRIPQKYTLYFLYICLISLAVTLFMVKFNLGPKYYVAISILFTILSISLAAVAYDYVVLIASVCCMHGILAPVSYLIKIPYGISEYFQTWGVGVFLLFFITILACAQLKFGSADANTHEILEEIRNR